MGIFVKPGSEAVTTANQTPPWSRRIRIFRLNHLRFSIAPPPASMDLLRSLDLLPFSSGWVEVLEDRLSSLEMLIS